MALSAADGECFRAEVSLEPGASGPPLHLHPTLEERFEGLEGIASLQIGRKRRTLSPGETAVAPSGVAHRFWNETAGPVRFHGEIRPPSEAFLRFMGTLTELARDGRLKADGQPRFLQGAVLLDEYLDVVALPGVPVAAQRVLFKPLAALGRLRGYRAHYP